MDERKKRIAEVQAKEEGVAAQIFEKPRTAGRERMTLRSATALTAPPAPEAATTVPSTRTRKIKTASPRTASTTKSGKRPAPPKAPLRTSSRLALNDTNQKGKKIKKV